jgi:hypothetical protein
MRSAIHFSIVLFAFTACSGNLENGLTEQVNLLLEPYLAGAKVELAPIKIGETFTVPALFAVDPAGKGGCLSIVFSRESFDDRFIQDLFFSKKPKLGLTPFTEPGVEVTLTANKIVLNLYGGVVMHIQSATKYPGGYSAFKVQNPSGEIVKIAGHAMHEVPGKPLPNSLVKFLYVRHGGFVMATDDKEKIAEANESTARMGLRFRPASVGKSVDPVSIACKRTSNPEPKG